MPLSFAVLKFLHILGATVILGTGTGIAFFMLMAHRSADASFIAKTAGNVVLADMIFTATAVLAQPITGYLLLQQTGVPITTPWVVASLCLYVLAGVFWLPVIWIQMRMRDLASVSAETSSPLPPAYSRLFRLWIACGFPGFGAVLGIIWLMVAKPNLG